LLDTMSTRARFIPRLKRGLPPHRCRRWRRAPARTSRGASHARGRPL